MGMCLKGCVHACYFFHLACFFCWPPLILSRQYPQVLVDNLSPHPGIAFWAGLIKAVHPPLPHSPTSSPRLLSKYWKSMQVLESACSPFHKTMRLLCWFCLCRYRMEWKSAFLMPSQPWQLNIRMSLYTSVMCVETKHAERNSKCRTDKYNKSAKSSCNLAKHNNTFIWGIGGNWIFTS